MNAFLAAIHAFAPQESLSLDAAGPAYNRHHDVYRKPFPFSMRTPRFHVILLTVVVSSLALSRAADTIDGFEALASGDTIQMRFTSGGCFHFYTLDLTFTRTNVAVAAVRLKVGQRGDYEDGERRELGAIKLSDDDLVKLDALLALYRASANSRGFCTTTDEVSISAIRGGKVIATEKFTDSSCLRPAESVLTIPALVRRLPEEKK